VDLFSSVWFGIFWLVLLFFYMAAGSALPTVRQHEWIELTEFQWFCWWPFHVLLLFFCLTLVTVTVRRIPLRPVNAGVWMIHSGIIILCAGSYYYFSTKIEGDTPVFRRQVRIEIPGLDAPASLAALPGGATTVAVGGEPWRFEVQSTNTAWPILSEEHKGKKAYAVNVAVSPPGGQPFIRQLLDGYPQYTEDVIPGKGRAIKTIGRKLVDEGLRLSLDVDPQKYFHLAETWALFVRREGQQEWVERPIEGLPRYHDRIGSRDQVFADASHLVELRPIDLPAGAAEAGDALDKASVRITGYLRYAKMDGRWREGGDRLNPVLRFRAITSNREESHELAALDPARMKLESGTVEFRWLDRAADVAALPTDSHAKLHVTVPASGVSFDLRLTADVVVGRDGPLTPIAGTEFSYRVINVADDLALRDGGGPVSVAMVQVNTPQGRFTRMVADRSEMTRDMHGESGDPHADDDRKPQPPDPRIVMIYEPRSAPVIFAAHPDGLYLVVNGNEGRILAREVAVGQTVEVVPGLSLGVSSLMLRAVAEVKPYVVPREQRDRDARETYSMIRLEVDAGSGLETKWVPYHHYALPNEQYAYSGRMAYQPVRFRMADGGQAEVLFSRRRLPLPYPVAMEDFKLDTHLGGYSPNPLTIRNYLCGLRFWEDGQWTEPVRTVAVNHPTEFGGYSYFQATWDRPPADNPLGGMNYTGLGVGNRNGVLIQLLGCCVAVAGMLFAFYVKPVLKRRRREQSRARSGEPMFTATEEVAAHAHA